MQDFGGTTLSFSYDNLNRLTQAQDASHWGEQYSFDNWGNMYSRSQLTGLGGDNWTVTPGTNNQLSNLFYDSAGNVTMDQFSNSYTYDAEGRMTAGGSGSYVYDGDGYRVEKTVGSTTTLYWPSAVAGVVDESNSAATSFGKQVYAAGLQVWSEDTSGTGKFLFQDHLGSTRVTADASGNVKDDIDYLPWGEQWANYGASPSDNHYLFTGYESDHSESSSEYATFRNLSGSMARFHRPDPYRGSYRFRNPQTLNRYAYVRNRPLKLTDPFGLDPDEDDPDPCDVDACVTAAPFGGADDGGGGGGADGCDADACVTGQPFGDPNPDLPNNGPQSASPAPNTPAACNPATSHCGPPAQTTCSNTMCHREPFTPRVDPQFCSNIEILALELSVMWGPWAPPAAAWLAYGVGVASAPCSIRDAMK